MNIHTSILVVDDEPMIRALVRRVLEKEYSSIVIVGSLQEGISSINRQEFDLLLTDLRLPDGHGVELMCKFHEKFL